MSKFERWFKMQFKRLPMRAEAHNKLLAEKQILEYRLSKINCVLGQDSDLDLAWKAALYAYQFGRRTK